MRSEWDCHSKREGRVDEETDGLGKAIKLNTERFLLNQEDARILGLQRRIQSGARDEA